MISTCPYPKPLFVMGAPITPFESYAHALECVESSIASGRKSFCVAINPEKVYRAGNDPRLMDVLRSADIGLCDGIGIVLAAR